MVGQQAGAFGFAVLGLGGKMSQPMADRMRARSGEDRNPTPASGMDIRLAWVLVAVMCVVMLGIFHEATWSLIQVWLNSRTYGHGFLIIPVAIWLAWQNRDLLVRQPVRPSSFGVVWIFAACLLWLLGEIAQANVLEHLALVAIIQGLVIAIMGVRIARILIFPLGYLLFMVPFGDFAIAPLQDLTARYTAHLLRLSGIPVYLENWSLVIPGGAFLVAEACAGVRFLIASIALGVLIAGIMFDSWAKRFIFVALSILVPIGANVVRAYGIVVIAHLSNFEMAVGIDHLVYGFVFLSFVMALLIGLAWLMRDRTVSVSTSAPALASADEQASVVINAGEDKSVRPVTMMRATIFVTIAVCLGLGIRLYAEEVMGAADTVAVRIHAPEAPPGWLSLGPATSNDWQGAFYGADAQGTWIYEKDGQTVSVFIAFYGDEGPDKELVSMRNSLIGLADNKIFESGRTGGDRFGDGIPAANYIILNEQGQQRTVWYWYVLEDGATAREPDVKLAGLVAKLSGRRSRGMLVALSSPIQQEGLGLMEDFIRQSALHSNLVRGGFDGIVMPDGGQ